MPDYEKLYHIMVAAAEDAIDALERQNFGVAKDVLIAAEQKAEEEYVSSSLPD